jgi:hypothetical protein
MKYLSKNVIVLAALATVSYSTEVLASDQQSAEISAAPENRFEISADTGNYQSAADYMSEAIHDMGDRYGGLDDPKPSEDK